MSIGKTYESMTVKNGHRYVFYSEGPKALIVKIVDYVRREGEVDEYNLGFGDFRQGKINDREISNNGDLFKIMRLMFPKR